MEEEHMVSVAYLPVGRVNFHMETARTVFQDSVRYLGRLPAPVQCPEDVLCTPEDAAAFLDTLDKPDLVIFQCTTFTDNRFITTVLERTCCPVLVWGVAEPCIDGSRLKLNSLTGVLGATNALSRFGRRFEMIYGAVDSPEVDTAIRQHLQAVGLIRSLRELTLGMIGTLPPGFTISDIDMLALQRDLGTRITTVELHQIINRSREIPDAEAEAALADVRAHLPSFRMEDEAKRRAFGAFHAALKEYVRRERIGVIAARCWPDVFEQLGVAPCASYSVLCETLPVACEVDVTGALTMYMLSHLGKSPCYFGDPVSINAKYQSVVFWHCGHGAPSLASPETGPVTGVHPNRLMAPAMDFGCKPGRVTVARFGTKPDGSGFRLFVTGGEAVNAPKSFQGTSAEVRMDCGSERFVREAALGGWEYHFAFVYGDVKDALALAGRYLGLDVFIL